MDENSINDEGAEISNDIEEKDNIWVASSDGDIARVQEILNSGEMNINSQDDSGYSPIHAATSYDQIDLLRFLLANGADVNLKDFDGDSPLHICETRAVAQILLEAGADPTLVNNDNQSIFDKAMEEENTEMVEFLVSCNLNRSTAPPRTQEDEFNFNMEEEEEEEEENSENP